MEINVIPLLYFLVPGLVLLGGGLWMTIGRESLVVRSFGIVGIALGSVALLIVGFFSLFLLPASYG